MSMSRTIRELAHDTAPDVYPDIFRPVKTKGQLHSMSYTLEEIRKRFSQEQIDAEVSRKTGEALETVEEHGFSIVGQELEIEQEIDQALAEFGV